MKIGSDFGIIKKKHLIGILFFAAIIISVGRDSEAAIRRMIGPNITMSWASSYLNMDSSSVTVRNDSSWTYATALGLFFDYMTTPYISFRFNWFFFPSVINRNYDDFNHTKNEISFHDIGFSLLRHFDAGSMDLWFGAGAYWQFSTLDDIDSYIVYAVLSFGFDYEVSEDIYLCPEFITGIRMRLINKGEEETVITAPSGKNFSSSGIIVFFKLGIAKAF
ncbi:MAG: hypothetical protein FWG49_01270 [Leptospirales bacterium]|nr:hypothetical protein [Leptospirales bacterium]